MINLHERMLPTSAGVEPATSWSPVGRRIQLSHRGRSCDRCNNVRKMPVSTAWSRTFIELAGGSAYESLKNSIISKIKTAYYSLCLKLAFFFFFFTFFLNFCSLFFKTSSSFLYILGFFFIFFFFFFFFFYFLFIYFFSLYFCITLISFLCFFTFL